LGRKQQLERGRCETPLQFGFVGGLD
jgi:hypothetical protein